MNSLKGLLFLFVGLIFFSCDGDRVFEEFQSIPNQNWSVSDTIQFDLSGLKAPGNRHLVGLRFTDEYPFTNAYMKLLAKDSLGGVLQEELINVLLFDPKSGVPFGKGFGNTHTHYDTLNFKLNEGVHSVNILQYMRQDELQGIESVGFKILK